MGAGGGGFFYFLVSKKLHKNKRCIAADSSLGAS